MSRRTNRGGFDSGAFARYTGFMSDLITGVRDFRLPCPYTLRVPPGYKASRAAPLVICLHGMGQNEDLIRRAMAPLLDEPWFFCFPRGCLPYEIRKPERRRIGYAWYVFDGNQEALRESMELGCRYVLEVQDVIRTEYAISRTAVVGFSQGGYLAGVVAAQNPLRFGAAACIAGRLKWEFMPKGGGVKLAQLHGARDDSVTPELARQAVEDARQRGYDTAWYEDPEAAHEVTPAMVEFLRGWLREWTQHETP